ncbi:MAG: L,D-transpeptidase [Solirubrobacteraceae bacterium]|nr:L,D-transpeptidase [Solirubrobacteraceae bacterium]
MRLRVASAVIWRRGEGGAAVPGRWQGRGPRALRAALVSVLLVGVVVPGAQAAAEPTPAAPTAKVAWLARVTSPVDLRSGASDSSSLMEMIQPTTQWGGDTQLLVKDATKTAGEWWVDVRVQGRPNGRHGWIRADKVSLSKTGYRIEVRRSTKRLTLLKGGRTVRSIKVVVGAPETPTPAGFFSIADKLELTNATNFLGSWVLPLTGYSDVLQTFDGGIGQVALHGRGGASLLQPVGTAASHGCVRIENSQIAKIAAAVPTGTPVVII